MTKIFESNTNTGFKYGFFPFLLLTISLIILMVVHTLYKEVYPLSLNIVLFVIISTILVEFILYKTLQKTNRIKVYSTLNGLMVSIKNENILLEQNVDRINYWWSYDNRGGAWEEKEKGEKWGDALDYSDTEIKNGSVRMTTMPLTRMLFLEIYSNQNTKIVLTEYFNDFKQIPEGWQYKLRPLFSDSEVEGYKLDVLKNRIDAEIGKSS